MPISLDFCTTETTSTLAMPSAAVRPTKKRMKLFDSVCADIAVKNWALVRIQLSACRCVCAVICCATVSASKRIAHVELDTRYATDQVEHALRDAQADVDVAAVDALVAEIEDAADGQCLRGTARGGEVELVAEFQHRDRFASSMPMTIPSCPRSGVRRRSCRAAQ